MCKIFIAVAVVFVAWITCYFSQPNDQSLRVLMLVGLGLITFFSAGAVTIPYSQGVGSQADYDNVVKATFFVFCFAVLALTLSGFYIGASWTTGLMVSTSVGLFIVLGVLI